MKLAKLLHNPKAGEKGHNKEDLIGFVESEKWECRYSSTKDKGWEIIEPEIDFLIIAGGDGTVRKVTAEILNRKILDKKLPVAILPMGTANNIAKTLGISGEIPEIVRTWQEEKVKFFDVGRIEGLEESKFFLEALGYGIFPRLIKEMKEQDDSLQDTPEKALNLAWKILHDIIHLYNAKYCRLEIDGTNYSGKFLMLEVMNIRSIGPNLIVAPHGDPGDGTFDVVLVPEDKRNTLSDYVLALMHGEQVNFPFETIKARNITLEWEGQFMHVDDMLIKKGKATPISIQLQENTLQFLIP